MINGSRLTRLSTALSARERAVLVLNAWKEGRPEDPSWRAMPGEQRSAFNRYIDLMNVVNRELALVISAVARVVHECQIRECWLVTLTLWQEDLDHIRRAVRFAVREPVTESEYRLKREECAAEWVSIRELAALWADDYDGWQEGELRVDEQGEREVTDEAWERVAAEMESRLRSLVAAGTLPSRGKGRALKIQWGAFEELTERSSDLMPEDWLWYRVLPDGEATAVERERASQTALKGLLSDAKDQSLPAKLSAGLREGIAFKMIESWIELRATETAIMEIADEFGGVDPLRPKSRQELADTKQALLDLREHLQFLHMDVVLREPHEAELEEVRTWVQERAGLAK
jgi:hypothetical protein